MFKGFIRTALLIVVLASVFLQLRPAAASSIYAYWAEPKFLHCDKDSVSFEYYRKYNLPDKTYSNLEFYLNGVTMVNGVEETGPYSFGAWTSIGYGFLPVSYPYSYRFIIRAYDQKNNNVTTSIVDGRCLDDGKGVVYGYQN
jgi:hypothetical protein